MLTSEQILNAKILIVEDDKLSRLLLKNILSSAGFKNIRALPNATRILRIYASYKPDLLVLDLSLPKVDGFRVLQQLKEQNPDDYLPVLVISQEMDDGVHLRTLAAGAKDFLSKPYDRPKVILRAKNLIEVRLLHNEVRDKNKDLEKVIRSRTQELRDTRLDVIRRLGYAAECRDSDTGQHIVRMSRYCAALAKAMGMNDEECDLVLTTSPLHDIGKIAIPDSVLLKPGQLTAEEWQVMKTHADIGGELLSGSDSTFLRMAETIARTHHERWDGSGYPRGLKGEDIPLVGRICAVCDVFDALTSDRPYKKAWSAEDALKEIRRLSGTHFDPRIVQVFFDILPDIRSIRREIETLVRLVSKETIPARSGAVGNLR
ncbi:MAG: response regulator [Candidatus Omnitrophica bacterium]|nr:response regulator [Candidatus Omnitrophota bacterium]